MTEISDNKGSATKLIPLSFVLLGLLVIVGVPFLISIFIFIFLGAIILLYKSKSEIIQRLPTLALATASTTATTTTTSSKLKNFWEKHDIWGKIVVLIFGTSIYILAWLRHS